MYVAAKKNHKENSLIIGRGVCLLWLAVARFVTMVTRDAQRNALIVRKHRDIGENT